MVLNHYFASFSSFGKNCKSQTLTTSHMYMENCRKFKVKFAHGLCKIDCVIKLYSPLRRMWNLLTNCKLFDDRKQTNFTLNEDLRRYAYFRNGSC